MPTRTVTILVRASGARKAAHDIDRLGGSLRSIGSIARTAGIGIGAIGAKAISTGISFNKMMETQTVALSGFVGGVKQANTFLNSLFEIAANTPFRFSDIVRGSRTLIAYGQTAKEARRTLEGLGNAIAAAGGGSEEIQRSVLALGQIQSAGVLHAQDLNQLIQTGVVTVPKLAKRLGMSTLEFRKAMEDGSITSEQFFKQMRNSWEKDPMYKGAAAKQAKTFQGQMEKLHDYTERTLGKITEPLFNALAKKVLPTLNSIAIEINKIFDAKNLDIGQKIDLSREVIRRKLRPLIDEFSTWWEKNHVGDKLDSAFKEFMDNLVELAGKGAAKGAKAFVDAWLGASSWAKVVTGGWLLAKFGLTGKALDALFGRGPKGGLKGGKTKGLPGIPAGVVPVWVVNSVGGGGGGGGGGGKPGTPPVIVPPGKGGKLGKVLGKVGKWGRRAGRGGIWGLMSYFALDALSGAFTGKGINENAKDSSVFGILKNTIGLTGGALGRIPGGAADIATGSLGVIGDQFRREGLGWLGGAPGLAKSIFPFSTHKARQPLPPYKILPPQGHVQFQDQSPMFGLDRLPQPSLITAPIVLQVDGQVLATAVARAAVRRTSTK